MGDVICDRENKITHQITQLFSVRLHTFLYKIRRFYCISDCKNEKKLFMCKNYAILSDCLNKISVYYEATPLKHDRHDFMGLFRSGSTELIYIN